MGPERVLGFPGEAGEIRVVDDQGREVGDRGHDSLDDGPAESASVLGGWLVHDRSDAVRADYGPDEECEACHGHEVGFDREQVADLMDGEPDRGQTAEPEEEEADKVHGVCSGALGHAVGYVLVFGPDGSDHQGDAFT